MLFALQLNYYHKTSQSHRTKAHLAATCNKGDFVQDNSHHIATVRQGYAL